MPRPSPLRGSWARLAAAYGGIEALATAIGVHPTTITRWASGAIGITGRSCVAVRAVAMMQGVRSPV
jgi:DNA-binding transcriptional regulator YdaS (Cro superfamily)